MQITSFNANALDDYINQRHIRYLILRDNLSARELAARANAAQEIAETIAARHSDCLYVESPQSRPRQPGVRGSRGGRRVLELAGHAWPGGNERLEAHSRLRRDRARRVARVGNPEALWLPGRRRDRTAVVPHPDHVRREPEAERGHRPGDRPGFPGPALSARRRSRKRSSTFPAMEPSTRASIRTATGASGPCIPTPGSFFKYQLPPFQAAVDAGTSSIMSYYNNPSNEKSGGTVSQGVVAVRQAAVRRSRRSL